MPKMTFPADLELRLAEPMRAALKGLGEALSVLADVVGTTPSEEEESRGEPRHTCRTCKHFYRYGCTWRASCSKLHWEHTMRVGEDGMDRIVEARMGCAEWEASLL